MERKKVLIPGSWINDPLLREKYGNNWVMIWSDLVSDQTMISVHKLLTEKKNPLICDPWWMTNLEISKKFDDKKKLYRMMGQTNRANILVELENFTGIEISPVNLDV